MRVLIRSLAQVPDSFTCGWQKNGRSSDGSGVDHCVDEYGDQLFGALFAALANE